MDKKVKIVKLVQIGDKTYKTAKGASEAWATAVLRRADARVPRRGTPEGDKAWQWHYAQGGTFVPSRDGHHQLLVTSPYTWAKAQRRSYPIFLKILGR